MSSGCSTRLPPDRAASGPGLVVQNDADNAQMAATILAQITTNLARARTDPPADRSVHYRRPESGLLHDSLVSCNNLVTVEIVRIQKVIGSLPATVMQKIDDCLRAALGLT